MHILGAAMQMQSCCTHIVLYHITPYTEVTTPHHLTSSQQYATLLLPCMVLQRGEYFRGRCLFPEGPPDSVSLSP